MSLPTVKQVREYFSELVSGKGLFHLDKEGNVEAVHVHNVIIDFEHRQLRVCTDLLRTRVVLNDAGFNEKTLQYAKSNLNY